MAATYNFGRILKQVRRLRGLTQEELAQKAGRSVDAVSQWERSVNWPGFDTMVRLSDALEVPVRAFFDQVEGTGSEERLQKESEARLLLSGLSDGDLAVAVEQLRALSRRR